MDYIGLNGHERNALSKEINNIFGNKNIVKIMLLYFMLVLASIYENV